MESLGGMPPKLIKGPQPFGGDALRRCRRRSQGRRCGEGRAAVAWRESWGRVLRGIERVILSISYYVRVVV